MRVLFIVCTTALLAICFAGCGQSEPNDLNSRIDRQVVVELTHVDPEVRAFLSRKQQAVHDAPDSSAAIGELAMAYEMNGFVDAALDGYRRATSLSSTNIRWPYFEGLVLASFGEYEDALTALDRALTIDATYAPAWIWKGRWHLELNEINPASDSFLRARDLGIEPAAIVGLARVALREDEAETALNLLQTLDQDDVHPEINRLVAKARTRLGLTDTANSSQQSQMAGQIGFPDPLSAEKRAYEVSISATLTRFRELLLRPEDQSSAFELVDSLYDKHPDNKRVVIAKAHRLRLAGDLRYLRALLEQAHSTWPAETNFTLGLAELEIDSQNTAEALRLINEALALEPDNTWGLLQKGIALAQQGRFDEAVSSLLRVLKTDETAEVHYYLGHAYAELADFSNARCHMNRAVELAPNFVQASKQLEQLHNLSLSDSQSDIDIESCVSRTAN